MTHLNLFIYFSINLVHKFCSSIHLNFFFFCAKSLKTKTGEKKGMSFTAITQKFMSSYCIFVNDLVPK
jgi:hypothetical protein